MNDKWFFYLTLFLGLFVITLSHGWMKDGLFPSSRTAGAKPAVASAGMNGGR